MIERKRTSQEVSPPAVQSNRPYKRAGMTVDLSISPDRTEDGDDDIMIVEPTNNHIDLIAIDDDDDDDDVVTIEQNENVKSNANILTKQSIDDDQDCYPHTPPPTTVKHIHAPIAHEASSMELDPTGNTKVYHLSNGINGSHLRNGINGSVSTSSHISTQAQTVVFRELFPVETVETRIYTTIQKDPLGNYWRVVYYPQGRMLQGSHVSLSVEMVEPSQSNIDNAEKDATVPTKRAMDIEICLLRQFSLSTSSAVTPLSTMNVYRRSTVLHVFEAPELIEYCQAEYIARKDLLLPDNGLLTSSGNFEVDIRLKPSSLTDAEINAQSNASTPPALTLLPTSPQVTTVNSTSFSQDNYDSKATHGMVGLKNQGATCYMNSLLQTLYHLRAFRALVYATPTEQEDTNNSVSLALQRVFYRLQCSTKAVSTKELTRSFGWSQVDAFMQHDVQELYRILCDRLEEKMKGTKVEGTIQKLFEGKVRSFIKCVNVSFESFREESFYDLQLEVKNCTNIYDSFRQYVAPELLTGENKYDAEGYGKQDARKGVQFLHFPPILNIQLMRFEYDPMRDGMVKIHDRFEFPTTLVLDEFLSTVSQQDNSSNASVIKPKHVYHLHSILVHSGDVNGGHYYVYVRPGRKDISRSNDWYKFDDDHISRVDDRIAVDGSFGSSTISASGPPTPSGSNFGEDDRMEGILQTASPNGDTGISPAHASNFSQSQGAQSLNNPNSTSVKISSPTKTPIQNGIQSTNETSQTIPLQRSFSSAYMLVYIRDGKNESESLFNHSESTLQHFENANGIKNNKNDTVSPKTTNISASQEGVAAVKAVQITDNNKLEDEGIVCPIPQSLVERFQEEERVALRRKRQAQTEHLFMNFRIASDISVSKLRRITKAYDFSSFGTSTHSGLLRIRMKRKSSIGQLYYRIYKRTGVPVAWQRLWRVITRENRTVRPDTPITRDCFAYYAEQLIDEEASPKAPVRLYLQILDPKTLDSSSPVINKYLLHDFIPPTMPDSLEPEIDGADQDKSPVSETESPLIDDENTADMCPPPVKSNEILLFIKFYDVLKPLGKRLTYMGNVMFDARESGARLATILHEILSIPISTEIILYEEIQPSSIAEISPDISLKDADIQCGDIICYQYAEDMEAEKKRHEDALEIYDGKRCRDVSYPDVESYFNYLLNLVEVKFVPFRDTNDEIFHLSLVLFSSYDEIIDAVADYLGLLSIGKRLYLRLHQHAHVANQSLRPLRHGQYAGRDDATLGQFLTDYADKSNTMYYERLSNPITEIEAMKAVIVSFSIYDTWPFFDKEDRQSNRVLCDEFLVGPSATVADLVELIELRFCSNQTLQNNGITSSTVIFPKLRVCEVSHFGAVIQRILNSGSSLKPYWGSTSPANSSIEISLFVEKIPLDEIQLAGKVKRSNNDGNSHADGEELVTEHLVYVTHFNWEPGNDQRILFHGVPFVIFFTSSDTIRQVKKRMQKRIGISNDIFSQWGLALVNGNRAQLLKEWFENIDSEALDDHCMSSIEDICGNDFQNLHSFGLEHADVSQPLAPKYSRRQELGIRIRQN